MKFKIITISDFKATADDLSKCFGNFGKLMEAKVVLDDKACSKRFGFVTYSTKEEADEVLKQRTLYLLGKKVNVGPAVKKEVLNLVSIFRVLI